MPRLGAQNSMWVAIVEKAFTHYRCGANTYASIAGGASTEVFTAFRMSNVASKTISTYSSAASMAADLLRKVECRICVGHRLHRGEWRRHARFHG